MLKIREFYHVHFIRNEKQSSLCQTYIHLKTDLEISLFPLAFFRAHFIPFFHPTMLTGL